MEFTKSHGAGNDFVMVEDLVGRWAPTAEVVRRLCDRHIGIGADGLIRIARSDVADFFMDYYNADGDAAEMCGNGIRCLAKYVADRELWSKEHMRVETRAGVRELQLFYADSGCVERVRVDMGPPILEPGLIPVKADDALHVPVAADGFVFDGASVSMGNPHVVLFVESLEDVPFEALGPRIEHHELFPAKVNVEFVQVASPGDVRVRVWERGVGETLACGSGACAVAVASSLRGLTERRVDVALPGGVLEIEWAPNDHVYLAGPAEEVFHGSLDENLEHTLLGWGDWAERREGSK
jgi:diaminopimelate epimerase